MIIVDPGFNGELEINIWDMRGQLVRRYEKVRDNIPLNRIGLESGVYVLEGISENLRYTKKLIIQ